MKIVARILIEILLLSVLGHSVLITVGRGFGLKNKEMPLLILLVADLPLLTILAIYAIALILLLFLEVFLST